MSEELVITQSGYDEIKAEYDYIYSTRRPAVIQRIKEARELGDLSENFDYQDAKREQGEIEGKLNELRFILENATIIPNAKDGKVGLGSKVEISYLDLDINQEITIVGKAESDPIEGKISISSPLGKSLLDKSAGDIVEYEAPSGIMTCKVIKVS